ncbi:tigger transposable element-derived protein 2-like [Colletes gigas]|uniref:tigger transposable element-derived protein 2-like n=1 Tax=Colletes gigas TaxID=935657 RepID=UPI001C9B38DA|nr:tigger transposable element-derived protein 2-like [Colletes gigas]
MIQEKAMELHKEFGGPSTFQASYGWLCRFKHRYGFTFRDYNGDAKLDTKLTKKFTHSFLQRLEDKSIELQNVYSMDETGLVWKALPRKTVMYATARRVYGKRIKKNRVTVALCANAIGTHKLPPLFIHRYETPEALKHCRDRLPVIFKARKNAWIDQSLFADWLEEYFKPAVRKYQMENGIQGKVLLLVDKCKAHTLPRGRDTEENNFEIIYLPLDTSSNLHPMQQGIIKNVKVSFRRRVLSRILDFPGGVAEFYTDYDVKDCIDLVSEAWTDVTQVEIYNSWKRLVGFGTTVEEEAGEGQGKESYEKADITAIKDAMRTILNEAISDKQVQKWLFICERAERDPSDFDSEDCRDKTATLERDEDEIDRMIARLTLWSTRQSDFVKLHARVVKDYYDLVQR